MGLQYHSTDMPTPSRSGCAYCITQLTDLLHQVADRPNASRSWSTNLKQASGWHTSWLSYSNTWAEFCCKVYSYTTLQTYPIKSLIVANWNVMFSFTVWSVSPWSWTFLQKLIVTHPINLPPFTEPNGSSPRSQEPSQWFPSSARWMLWMLFSVGELIIFWGTVAPCIFVMSIKLILHLLFSLWLLGRPRVT